jgi:glycine cleavage system H protein
MRMAYPAGYRYSEEHEWVRVEGAEAVLGITDFAQEELGDVVFVELPEIGDSFEADEEIGTIESVKAVAEIYTPLSGEVVGCNSAIDEAPDLVNKDPHGDGWLVRIRMSEPGQLDGLMSAAEYLALTGALDS